MTNIPVFGVQPSLVGQVIEAIVVESFLASGELVCNANAVFFRCANQWHRLVLDAGTVHWKVVPTDPAPWSVPEQGWSYPHRSVGQEFGLVGVPVASASLGEEGAGLRFVLAFANGRRFVVANLNDRSSCHVD